MEGRFVIFEMFKKCLVMNSEASIPIETLKPSTGALKDTKVGGKPGRSVSRRNNSSFNRSMHRHNVR